MYAMIVLLNGTLTGNIPIYADLDTCNRVKTAFIALEQKAHKPTDKIEGDCRPAVMTPSQVSADSSVPTLTVR